MSDIADRMAHRLRSLLFVLDSTEPVIRSYGATDAANMMRRYYADTEQLLLEYDALRATARQGQQEDV